MDWTKSAGLASRFFVAAQVVIARSACDEAIHLLAAAKLDCFAALAMTVVYVL
jgi:hypothetical protein